MTAFHIDCCRFVCIIFFPRMLRRVWELQRPDAHALLFLPHVQRSEPGSTHQTVMKVLMTIKPRG